MKKNLLSVVILALVVANVILSGIIVFTLVPQTKQANNLITKVCEAIDLEINSGAATGLSNLPVKQITPYAINAGETITTNLAKGEDGEVHYVVFSVSLNLNNESDEYKENTTTSLTEKESIILDTVNGIARNYSLEALNQEGGVELMKKEMLKELQNMFGADFIVGISYPKFNTD
uniref:flagellar basal body-associated FliL family protein n=1 Tax=Agathobacter sp. TaxID=2021311 RepID=UPI0040561027